MSQYKDMRYPRKKGGKRFFSDYDNMVIFKKFVNRNKVAEIGKVKGKDMFLARAYYNTGVRLPPPFRIYARQSTAEKKVLKWLMDEKF